MDGVSWRTTRAQESFVRPGKTAETLSKLASFIARADTKHHAADEGGQPSHLAAFVCQECGKGFPYARDLPHHHGLKHALPKPHRCASCGRAFSLRSTLQLHRCAGRATFPCEPRHGEPHRAAAPCPSCAADKPPHCQPHLLDRSPYACAPCGRGFAHKQALLHHQQSGCGRSSSPPPRTARACSPPDDSPPASKGDAARSDLSLRRHGQTEHLQAQLTAPQTRGGGGGGGEVKVDKDAVKKPASKPLVCRSCDMVFWSTSKLYLHRREWHSRESSARGEAPPVKRRKRGSYPCQICGKVFVHHLSLRSHYRHHSASSFSAYRHRIQSVDKDSAESSANGAKAGRPGRKAKKAIRLKNKVAEAETCKEVKVEEEEEEEKEVVVVEDKEDEEEEEEEEGKEFPCPSCPEVFSARAQLREHVELHQSSVKRRRCSVCADEMDTCRRQGGSRRQRLYHCVPCQQGFSTLDPFLQHCQEHVRVRVDLDCMTEGHACQASTA